VPDAVPFFTGNANSSRSVALSWVSSPRASTFEIQRRTGSSAWSAISTTGVAQTYYTDNSVQPSTLYSYRVVARNAGGSAVPSNYILVNTWSTLADWRFQNYGTLTDAGVAASTADNGTGVPNLLKFAFNMAAEDRFYHVQESGGAKGMPLIQFESESGLLRVAFIRRRAETNAGIQYQVQFSDNLADWSSVGQELMAEPINESFEYVVWQDEPWDGDTPARNTRFGRVLVTE
ncbi:MAG TPA: fibronectin type III domain-containing protein, partial [Verrucomicrobium sp.]|nr:fibronectin type III domain-containing protein [Verrucomicrobium sp.]